MEQRRKFYRSLCLLVTSAFTVRLQYKNLIRGILLDNVRWLSLLATREDRRQAFGAFTNWTVNYFIGLLRGFFYATETQFGKFEIFFYQNHVWRGICKYSTTIGLSLTTGTGRFEKTRLIPKKSSVRMICPDQMLTGADTETEIREQGALVSILQMLRSDPRPFIFDNFSEFCETVRAIPHGNLFMVKADIRDCYPCIKQAVLSDIIRKKVACVFGRNNSGTIICQEVRSVILSSGSLKVKTHYVPIPHRKEEQMDDFTDEQEFGFTSLRNRILAPSAVIAVQEPLNKIISQFRGNVIKQGSNFYLLSEGIRQGGRLSPELCHLYMESFLCSMFRDAKKLHIALKADDILIASSDKEEAETALQRIVDGSHKFNFRANREKIFTNFESKSCVQVHSRIPFCGSFYDCDTRSVMADFTRFQTSHLKYSFNCNPFHKAMAMAKYVANQFSHMRFHLMDSRHNDADVVVRNFYERFLFQGMRFACFLLCSDSHKQSQDAKLLEHFANLLAHKAYKLYHCGSLRQGPGCSLLSEREVHFICSSAIL